MRSFCHSFQSEWLKKKHSLASWMVVIGGFFTPLLIIIARLLHYEQLPKIYSNAAFWQQLWYNAWESMALFLLPIGVVMAISLITQLEYKNNSWKVLHTLPLKLSTIFFSKLLVLIVMLFQFFVLFNIGIYLMALVPYLLVAGISFPDAPIPWAAAGRENVLFFIDCLPIIALQYLVSLRFRNFIVPIGCGFLCWLLALSIISWKHGYWMPYTYTMFNFFKERISGRAVHPPLNIHWLAIGYFVVITTINYILYITKKEKG